MPVLPNRQAESCIRAQERLLSPVPAPRRQRATSRQEADDRDAQVDVCIVGAGPVGGTLACRLARRACAPPSSTAPRCRRWSTRISTAAPMPSPPARAACWRRPGCGTRCPFQPGPILRHPRHRRPRRPPGVAAVPAFRRRDATADRRPGGVRLDGGGAQPARGAERPAARAARRCPCSPRPTAPVERRRRGRAWCTSPAARRIACRLVVAAEGRAVAAARAGRHSGDAPALRPDRHRLRHRPRAAAPRHRAGAFPARRPVRAAADGAAPRRAEHVSAIVWTERDAMAAARDGAGRRRLRPRDRRAGSATIWARSACSAGAGAIRCRRMHRAPLRRHAAGAGRATPRTASTRSPARG